MATASMQASEPARRASGRVRKQPDVYMSSPASNGKRKRHDPIDGDDDAEMVDAEDASDAEESSDEEEPDDEEVRERSKKARKPKKPKPNGTSLAIRTAPGGAKKRAARRGKAVNTQDAEEAGGLFAQVFAGGERMEAITSNWLKSFDSNESIALASVVAFVLRCAGCESVVTDDDIGDPDGCSNRLTDIQDEFQATAPTEYPLIAKGRAGAAFRETMSEFFNALIKSVAASGKLYDEPLLIDNLEIWLSTMSSAGNRAFRHTATVASLSIITGLAEVCADRAKAAADWQHQASELRAKKNHNRARAKDLDDRVQDATKAQDFILAQLKDWFEAVFIHRYRDVDPAIRRDCAIALTDWAIALPDHFYDGSHLRYLGWVLSDTASNTRAEVVKQVQRLYKEKDKITRLRTFTERFRPRIVEIAIKDSDSTIRASGIDLLDNLREHGLLEPNDIDAVGRLIYDSDPRVRKSVSSFFAELVAELYTTKIDEMGGMESLEESLPEPAEDNFDIPRLEWLTFKSLAEMMVAYDVDDDVPAQMERKRDGGLNLRAGTLASRFTLAADALYDKIDEIQDWQSLAGYLLYDHTAGRAGSSDDPVSQLTQASKLEEGEEVVLLELVSASVKHAITGLAEKAGAKNKLTKRQKDELSDEQEEASRHLATLIPKLLRKFGDVPSTAAAVLRMEGVLNLPPMRGLRQDSVAYGALLDDIRRQFMSHGTDEVLGPASEAILHAKSYGELDDLTEEKLGTLWEDVINNLAELIDPTTISVRGTSSNEQLLAVSNNLLRITRLAQVSNCTTALEDSTVTEANKATGEDDQGAIDYIISLIQRALPAAGPAIPPEDSALEDQVAAQAAEAALRYLQWKIQLIMQTMMDPSVIEIPFDDLEALATRRDQYVDTLDSVLQARKPGDGISINVAKCMLELHTSAVILKNIKLRPGMRDNWEVLILNLHTSFVQSILRVFTATEKNFAVLSKKHIQKAGAEELLQVDLDADPVDDEPMSDPDEEEEEHEEEQREEEGEEQARRNQQRKEKKLRKIALAEQALCELTGKMIFAIHAGVDEGAMRKRLERNRTRLGPNYKELVAYIDVDVVKGGRSKGRGKAGNKARGTANGAGKANPKSNAIVAEDEVEDEIEDDEVEGEEVQDEVVEVDEDEE